MQVRATGPGLFCFPSPLRLVQLEQVAERIVKEGLVSGAGDERDPVHLDALLLQIGDGGIDVIDLDRFQRSLLIGEV
jgi:hypothetical protein